MSSVFRAARQGKGTSAESPCDPLNSGGHCPNGVMDLILIRVMAENLRELIVPRDTHEMLWRRPRASAARVAYASGVYIANAYAARTRIEFFAELS